jgi:hypothetical protein
MNTGIITAAVDQDLMRDLVEINLIEEYHWTPDYIASLPYKWIQKHNYMRKIKHASLDAKQQQAKFRASSSAKGLKPGEKSWEEI